jgi:hypothetical protein
MARSLIFLLSALFLAACNAQELSSTLRRGGHAVIPEEVDDSPAQRRQLWGWFTFLMASKLDHILLCQALIA